MKPIMRLVKAAYLSSLQLLPVKKNKAVFFNFGGRGFGDSPRYIAEELHRQKPEWEFIWVCKDPKTPLPNYISPTRIWSIPYYYHLLTAAVIINNTRAKLGTQKRANQTYLQTWHGPASFKPVEADVEQLLSPGYVQSAKYDGQIADGILSNSALLDEQYKRCFWLGDQVELLPFGFPRNDCFFQKDHHSRICQKVHTDLKLPDDDYIVLYAPTFRDDHSTLGYHIDFTAVRQAFEKMTGKKCRLLIKFHPNAEAESKQLKYDEFMLNVTDYSDVQELAIASDAIISDYSSTVFDFAMMNKPVFLCALDVVEYKEKRGLTKAFYLCPFPRSYTNDELIHQISTFNESDYFASLANYHKQYPIYDNGNAANQTAAWIIQKVSEKLDS